MSGRRGSRLLSVASLCGLLLGMVGAGMPSRARATGPDFQGPPGLSGSWDWVRSQLLTGTRVSTPSTITPDEPYPASWTGPVSGTFTLRDVTTTTCPSAAGMEVQAHVVTDAWYPAGTAQALADGTFRLPDSRPGTKVFHLVDVSTGNVVAEAAPQTGLVRSFEVPPGSPLHGRSFTYDQSLALLTALSVQDRPTARALTEGLLALQTEPGPRSGGFVSSSAALNPKAALPEYRTGIHSIATYALLRVIPTLPAQDPLRDRSQAAATRGVAWLQQQQAADGPLAGLVTGGHGVTRPDGSFDPDAALQWASTEHNLDAWHTLGLANTVLGDESAAASRDRLDTAVQDLLWDEASGGFLQGRSAQGPDPTHALDVNSWGAIYLHLSGRPDRAARSLERTTDFAQADPPLFGHAPHEVSGRPLVWTEGSAGVALAQVRLGQPDQAALTLHGLEPAALPSGAWRAASRDDPDLSMTTVPAVAATTWVLLAHQARAGQPTLWDESPSEGVSDR